MRTSVSVLLMLTVVLGAAPRAGAQTTHTAPQSALDAALQQHVSTADKDRATVLKVLDHPEVKSVAAKSGIDLRTVTSAVSTLNASELASIAAQANQVDEALSGGQSRVVISTTLIIIALLVLILIIVAVD